MNKTKTLTVRATQECANETEINAKKERRKWLKPMIRKRKALETKGGITAKNHENKNHYDATAS